MKKGMCRGCDKIIQVQQVDNWYPGGLKRRPEPIVSMKDYCTEHHLHLTDPEGRSYIDRIIDGDKVCPYYRHDGVS